MEGEPHLIISFMFCSSVTKMVFYYNWPVFDENRANYAKNAGYTTSRIQNKVLN